MAKKSEDFIALKAMAKKADPPTYQIIANLAELNFQPMIIGVIHHENNKSMVQIYIDTKSVIITDSELENLFTGCNKIYVLVGEKQSDFEKIDHLLVFIANGIKRSVIYRYVKTNIEEKYYIYI
jgi:hypothetical protein